MIVEEKNIGSVILHRPPFVMIGNLISADDVCIVSNYLIPSNNVLCSNGVFSFAGLIENIAQTCAAGFGFLDQQKGETTKMGFIGAISKLKAIKQARAGELILTKVEIVTRFNNITLIRGANYCGNHLLLECEMKIVITEV